MPRTIYAVASSALAVLGALHMAATFRLSDGPPISALWFFSGGVLMALCAAINFLNRAYGAGAAGLRWVCLVTNLVVTAIAVAGGVLGKATAAEWVMVIGVLGTLIVLSARQALRNGR